MKPLIAVLLVAACSQDTTLQTTRAPDNGAFPTAGKAVPRDVGPWFFRPQGSGSGSTSDDPGSTVETGSVVIPTSTVDLGGGSTVDPGGGSAVDPGSGDPPADLGSAPDLGSVPAAGDGGCGADLHHGR